MAIKAGCQGGKTHAGIEKLYKIRPSRMKSGRRLLADKDYPPKSIVNRLAEMFAVQFTVERN